MRKWLLVALAALPWATPADAQVAADPIVICGIRQPGSCIRATPVTNPDGSNVGGGSTGTAGSPSAATTTVQGITGGTAINEIGRGGSTILTGQISVGTTATLIAAARANRQKIGVTVTTAVQCSFGPAGVTLSSGWPLAAVAYAADSWDTSAALYGICASAATTVGWREQY